MKASLSLATLLTTAMLVAPFVAAEHDPIFFETEGHMMLGTYAVGIGPGIVDAVISYEIVELPDGVAGKEFELVATSGDGVLFGDSPDFDVCFFDADGAELECFFTTGGEAGTVPSGAASADIYLFDGYDTDYRLTVFNPPHEEEPAA